MDINTKLGAVIVTFFPNQEELKSNIKKYYDCFERIVLVDNGTMDFDSINFTEFDRLKIIKLGFNKGIAAAQNIGIQYLLSEKIDFFIFFDQDSFMTAQDCVKLVDTFKDFSNTALVGPTIVEKTNKIFEVSQTLSSGSVIPRNVINDVGLMNEELFIDLVDYEWCWRAKKKKYKILINNNVFLNHKLGEGKNGIFGIPQPSRHYYQFRNTVYVLKTKECPIMFKVKYSCVLPIKYIYFSFFIKDKNKRVPYIRRGIRDGFSRKLGVMKK